MGGVIGIGMCKDEVDVAETVVRHMASQVDFVIVFDNRSTDGTYELLDSLSDLLNLSVQRDPDAAYYQSRKMTVWAHAAFKHGYDWIVPFDFDEVWTSPHGRIADVLTQVSLPYAIAWMHDHVPTDADDQEESDPFRRMVWRQRERGELPKIACRTHPHLVIHAGNHGASPPGVTADGVLEIRHFPWRSDEQAITKARNGAAAYAATDLPEGTGWHWRQYGGLLELEGEKPFLERIHADRWAEAPESDSALVWDPVRLSAV